MSYAFTEVADQRGAFRNRVLDALVRVKQELGVDELLLAIDDASEIASTKVSDYLAKYKKAVKKNIETADETATGQIEKIVDSETSGIRSARNIEKLVALSWKNSYELDMTDLNARMPLAQQIVSKYMANFSVKPSMK